MCSVTSLTPSAVSTATAIDAAAAAAGVINTNLGRHKLAAKVFYALTALISKSEPQGAATNVYCAFGDVEGGAYYTGTYVLQCCLVELLKFVWRVTGMTALV